MSKKDLVTTLAAAGIKDPNYSKTGADPQQIEDKDFTDATNDISAVARVTLGVFLSAKTTKNPYPVSPTSALLENKTRGENAGLLFPSNRNDQKTFASQDDMTHLQSTGLGVKNATLKNATNRQVTFFDADDLSSLISKDANNPDLSADTLLKEIPQVSSIKKIGNPLAPPPTGEGRGNELLRTIHKRLVEGNMYSPDDLKPFLANPGGENEEEVTRGLFSVQRNLGSFDVNGQRVKVSDMSAIAMASLLRADGNFLGASLVLERGALTAASFTALTPFLRPEQFGAAGNDIDVYRLGFLKSTFTTAEGPRAIIAASATGQNDFIIKLGVDEQLPSLQRGSENSKSIAQMNTFLEPFSPGSRFTSFGMFLLGASAVLIILGISIVINQFSTFSKKESLRGVPSIPSTLELGRYNKSSSSKRNFTDILYDMLSVTNTDYDFTESVERGIKILFGIPDDVSSAQIQNPTALVTVASNLLLTGGFYANFARRLVASGNSIVDAFSNITFPLSPSGIESLLAAIESILNSMIWKFVMISAAVGDISLKSEFGSDGASSDDMILSLTKSKSLDPFVLAETSGSVGVYRNQLYRWGGQATGVNSLSLKTFYAAQRPLLGVVASTENGNRFLSPGRDQVQNLEDKLDAEYMPFYIHDLRTHEIISMPAFITEFGETFNANYNSVEGIGRQDAVRLYQKTERTVNFGFVLASHNQDDHDHMWLTINKLIAMCYPQYSKGRVRETEADADGIKTKFIQPFSQVQAASPMVRLRLGDVFKSNYSKYGLMRLFGVGQGNNRDFDVNKNDSSQVERDLANKVKEAEIAASEKVRKQFLDAKENGQLEKGTPIFLTRTSQFVYRDKDKNPITVNDLDEATIVEFKQLKTTEKRKSGKIVEIVNPIYIVNHKKSGNDIAVLTFQIKFFTEAEEKKRVDKDQSVIDAKQNLQNEAKNTKNGEKRTVAENFFKSENNAIVRSFETTRGRGVAGFITSIGLDYGMGNHLWDIRQGSRAPMVVKISLGFTPITDLPLGLDYYGDIRNPSHPVGQYAGSFGDPYYSLQGGDENPETTKPMRLGDTSFTDENNATISVAGINSNINSRNNYASARKDIDDSVRKKDGFNS